MCGEGSGLSLAQTPCFANFAVLTCLLFSAAMALADLTLLSAWLIDFWLAVIPASVVCRFMSSAPELLLDES